MSPKSKTALKRCEWPGVDPLMIEYHDREWGKPVKNDRIHFEFLILDAAQAGLSWSTVLKKRDGYRRAFAEFDPVKVARFTEKRIEKLLVNPEIIRNRLKVQSAVTNARAFLDVQDRFGSFNKYIWGFVNGAPIHNHWEKTSQIPSQTKESAAMSKDMKQRGFAFCGPTICYAYMQAAGMVNDHLVSCFRHAPLAKSRGTSLWP